jgi:hypothetical protein
MKAPVPLRRAPPDLREDLTPDPTAAPQYRYFAVLALTLAVVVLLTAAPNTDLIRALVLAIEGAALVITVGTSRERPRVRRRRARTVGLGILAFVVLVGLGVMPSWITALVGASITVAIPATLIRGLLRLIREHGVTGHAVAGSLAIYLSTGLLFAWVIAFIAQVSSTPYFAQQTANTLGDKVYYSFTVLTTTGFGDFTPANPVGHAVAVLEMLTGQLYLVTVIGLLIGNFAAGRRAP